VRAKQASTLACSRTREGYLLAKQYKKTFPQSKTVHSHVLQVAIEDLDKAYQSFFRRVKAGEEPGYPRFKSYKRWHSIGFKQYNNGFKVDGRRLKVSGVGRIKIRWHRPYQGDIKTCRVIRKAGQWYVSLMCEVPEPAPLPKTGCIVGIDMGINALITTNEGEQVDNPRWYREAQSELRRKQRRLQRARKGSNQRKKKLLRDGFTFAGGAGHASGRRQHRVGWAGVSWDFTSRRFAGSVSRLLRGSARLNYVSGSSHGTLRYTLVSASVMPSDGTVMVPSSAVSIW